MGNYSYNEMLVMTLAGHEPGHWNFFMSRKEAYEQLKQSSGHDFGFDVGKWKEWVDKQRETLNRSLCVKQAFFAFNVSSRRGR